MEALGLGSKASSMGSAFAGLADDGFALYYNPAGLAQIKGRSFGGVCVIGASRREFHSNGEPVAEKSPVTVGPLLVGTTSFGLKNFMFAGSQMSTFGGYQMLDEFHGDLRFSSYNVQYAVFPMLYGFGYRVNDWFSFGATLQIGIFNKVYQAQRLGDGFLGRTLLEQMGIPLSTVNGVDDGKLEIQSDKEVETGLKPLNAVNVDGRSFSYILGVLFTPLDSLRIGVTYREELRSNYEGEIRQELAQDLQASLGPFIELAGMSGVQSARFKLLLKLPRQVVLGLAWLPTEKLALTTDYVWTNWSTWKDQVIWIEGSGISGMNTISVSKNFHNTHSFRTGLEYAVTPVFRVRAGYYWDPTPVPARTLDLPTADTDRHVYTAGLGFMGMFNGRLNVECYVQVLDLVSRTIRPGESENLGGTKISLEERANDTEMKIGGYVLHAGMSFTIYY